MRLEKYIATSGIASRRKAKKSIRTGCVTVNGKTVFIPGHPIDVETDCVEFEGRRVEPITQHIYLMLNKPAGYVTTRRDERGRPTVMDLVADIPEPVYPIGRLDLETEGLLLFTNDGEFAYRLMHPSHQVEKTYLAWINGIPSDGAIQRLHQGVTIPSGKTGPAKVKRLKVNKESTSTQFEVVIHEGKKRQIRLMFKVVGHPVLRLKRVRIGNLRLSNLPQGQYRFLTPGEIAELKLL